MTEKEISNRGYFFPFLRAIFNYLRAVWEHKKELYTHLVPISIFQLVHSGAEREQTHFLAQESVHILYTHASHVALALLCRYELLV